MLKNLLHHIVLILFIAILSVPMLDRKLHIFPLIISTEKRELAPRPVYSNLKSLPDLVHAFDSYWSDNFGGRANLITLQSKIWVKLFRESPIPSVVIGKDGWSFYKSEAKNDGPGINDLQGLVTLKKSDADIIYDNLGQIISKLESKGIRLIILVAPNKHTVYKEMLPPIYRSFNTTTRLDSLISTLPENINLVDVRDVLHDGKSIMPTYQVTDSHWSSYGAFLAVQKLKEEHPDISRTPLQLLSDYDVVQESVSGEGDLVSMMSARGIYKDISQLFKHKRDIITTSENFEFLNYKYSGYTIKQKNQNLPTLLFTGDSFASYMNPFLAPYFSNIYVTTYKQTGLFEDELLDLIRPDVIIWEVAERYIDRLATTN